MGCDLFVQSLEHAGVDTIFAYPGGASMMLHQSLTRSKKIRTILPRHEQGGAFMAEGYARATGKAGVVMATSGPGATNLVTGIADAYMDSVPMIAITGQVPTTAIGRGAFQETDVFGVTLPIVKHSYLVMSPGDIPRVVAEAFHIATTGRPGPVLIDIPKDVQKATAQVTWPAAMNIPGYHIPLAPDESAIHEILGLIEKAQRPMLYVGGGIITSGAEADLLTFARTTGIPVTTTLMGIGCFPENDPQSLKWLGMHGTVYANYAVNECDLLLALGVRFDDRVTGKVSEFAKKATIVHIDIDASELNKNKIVHMPVLADVRLALRHLNQLLSRRSHTHPPKRWSKWREKIKGWRKKYPFSYTSVPNRIMPQQVIEELCHLTHGEAIVTTGVGLHQMWTGQFYNFNHPRSFLTSAGLGSMGFGYPAALGAKVACPNREVIDIDGDGSFLMNVQELATAMAENIPAKAIIINNQHLGMVVQWEDRFFSGNRGHTFLGDPKAPKKIFPDYIPICQGFGVPAERITKPEEIRPALQRLLDSKTAYVLDVIVPYTEHVLPMIPAGGTIKDIILEPMQLDNAPLQSEVPG
ncbi:MAG: biosynthetic-type acetolactate synthase large subunit [Verrucomicrobia bacterium]|nr:biosynthetic-type acetolactate synthase large subunit [Verrucomicrobiota bacterium]